MRVLFGLFAISREITASYAKYKILLLFLKADPQIVYQVNKFGTSGDRKSVV